MTVVVLGKVGRREPMSRHPREIPPVPEETRRVARAAFPRGNLYMRLRDELGVIYTDPDIRELPLSYPEFRCGIV
jgi:transposase